MKTDKNTRQATVDSIFYPGERNELLNTVKDYMNKAPGASGEASAILTPHGSYSYTGSFMARGFKAVSEKEIERVIIISRVHREPEKAIFLPSCSTFETPLGKVPLDFDWIDILKNYDPVFKTDDIPHTEEHSIEVQLPFIQYLWPKAFIVPVLTGTPSLSLAKKLAGGLKTAGINHGEETLYVVSSNLSAYDHLEDAQRDTDYFINLLENGEWETFPKLLNEKKINACSADALTALYFLFNGKLSHKILEVDCKHDKDKNHLKKPFEKRVCFGAISFKKEESDGF